MNTESGEYNLLKQLAIAISLVAAHVQATERTKLDGYSAVTHHWMSKAQWFNTEGWKFYFLTEEDFEATG